MAILSIKPISENRQYIFLQVIGWIIYTVYFVFINSLNNDAFHPGYAFIYVVPFIAVFYASLYSLSQFNRANGVIRGITALILLFVLVSILVYIYIYWLLPLIGIQLYHTTLFNLGQFLSTIWGNALHFVTFAVLYFIVQGYYLKKVKQAEAESALLRAQIQPHFLYNTLNAIYAQALLLDEGLANNIWTLSRIMRYSLDNTSKDGLGMLSLELQHLELLIRIYQLRYSNNLQIHYEVIGDKDNQVIPPLALITIVENAFKHGDLKDPGSPLTIRADRTATRLLFYCANKKNRQAIARAGGRIGLANLTSRLELVLKGRYTLQISDRPTEYSVVLIINYEP